MAFVLQVNRKVKMVKPNNARYFTLKELQGFVGGYIELVYLDDDITMVVNEEGVLRGLKTNYAASFLARVQILGDVLVCKRTEIK